MTKLKLKDYKDKIKDWPEKLDQSEIAKKFCLLQPCEIQKDEATGGCYGCKIGSSIKNTFDQALNLISNLEFNPADYVELDKDKITHILDIEIRKQIKEGLKDNRWLNLTTLVQAIVDSRDVVKAKKEIIK